MRFYDDDGNEINPELAAKPSLCLTCKKDGDPSQEVFCTLTRADQQDEAEFRCDAYEFGHFNCMSVAPCGSEGAA